MTDLKLLHLRRHHIREMAYDWIVKEGKNWGVPIRRSVRVVRCENIIPAHRFWGMKILLGFLLLIVLIDFRDQFL